MIRSTNCRPRTLKTGRHSQKLFFIASADLSAQTRDVILNPHDTPQYLDLVIVESEQSGRCVMKQVGNVITMGVRLRGENEEAIQGLLR